MIDLSGEKFCLEQWLNGLDVSDRDETLDEPCARMYLLHKHLVSSETSTPLAKAIVEQDVDAIDYVSSMAQSEEPRFAAMVLVDLLVGLGSSRSEKSTASGPLAVAISRVACAMPSIVNALCEKAIEGDVCGDALSYTLTLLSFLLGETGCHLVEDIGCVQSVSTQKWLKLVMRIWKDSSLVGHVPGEEAPDNRRGLGYMVTIYLERISSSPGAYIVGKNACYSSSFAIETIASLGLWFVSFVCMRIYSAHVSDDERGKLAGILWRCGHSCPQFGIDHVYNDSRAMQAICDSASKVVCPSLGLEGVLEIKESELCLLAGSGSAIFSHLLLLQDAVKRIDITRNAWFLYESSASWFWNALMHCADVCWILCGYYRRLAGHAIFLKSACSYSCLSAVLWRVCYWMAAEGFRNCNVSQETLGRYEVLQRLLDVAKKTCKDSAVPIQAHCAKKLAEILLADDQRACETAKMKGIGQICEWCFASDRDIRLKSCGGCKRVYFCDAIHLRSYWKTFHRRECQFLRLEGKPKDSGHGLGSGALRIDESGSLFDVGCNENVGRICAREYLDAVLQIYGAFVSAMGGSLRIVYTDAHAVDVAYLPLGQLLREELEASGGSLHGLEFVLKAMAATSRLVPGGHIVVSIVEQWRDSKRRLILHKTKSETVQNLRQECITKGCVCHDEAFRIEIG